MKASMPIFYDTHAHLDYPDYASDLPEVIERARNAGIAKIISIGTDLASSRRAVQLAERFPNVFAGGRLASIECRRSAVRYSFRIARVGEVIQKSSRWAKRVLTIIICQAQSRKGNLRMMNVTSKGKRNCSGNISKWRRKPA